MHIVRRSIAALLVSGTIFSFVQAQSPKREFRGAWIATVANLDWPTSRGVSIAETQKTQLVTILDALYDAGLNAVVFQVRSECDALYQSPYEPWSYYLTGSQGTAPNPFYDPLQFAVEEAHKRGMEIHAWFNPYRAYRETNTYTTAANHVTKSNPELVLTCPDGYTIMDPGQPGSRDYITRVISDVVRRYDVDGVHMDDYFYPYASHGFTTEDSATFRIYPRGFATNQLADWRRDNVNILMQQLYDSIQVIKPWVKLGVSPFGIWRSGVPNGIVGMSAVDVIYCDALAWLQAGSIDYLNPQMYWAFGGGQDYGTLQKWWSDSTAYYGRHLYSGNATYRIVTNGWPTQEIVNQLEANRANPNVQGSVQFRANFIRDNGGGITDRLKNEVFRYGAAIPVMTWKETIPPNNPAGLVAGQVPGSSLFQLTWNVPPPAADGDTASRYVVYRVNGSTVVPGDISQGESVLILTGERIIVPPARADTPGVTYAYAVSSLDKNNNESGLSNSVQIGSPPPAPTLVSPPEDFQTFAKTGLIAWDGGGSDLRYRVQVSADSAFPPGTFVLDREVGDTTSTVPGLNAQSPYYWRVMSGNQGGTSQFSSPRTFTTGWPLPPTVVSPHLAQNVDLKPTFTWTASGGTSFTLRVVDDATFAVVINKTLNDTTYTATTSLTPSRIFTWTVRAINAYGDSDPSSEGRFRTVSGTYVENSDEVPEAFRLDQNFPNPFNPTTVIRFAVRESGPTTLRIYNLLGQQVTTLADDVLPAGTYVAHFDGGALPSGTYFYVLTSGAERISKRMMLVK